MHFGQQLINAMDLILFVVFFLVSVTCIRDFREIKFFSDLVFQLKIFFPSSSFHYSLHPSEEKKKHWQQLNEKYGNKWVATRMTQNSKEEIWLSHTERAADATWAFILHCRDFLNPLIVIFDVISCWFVLFLFIASTKHMHFSESDENSDSNVPKIISAPVTLFGRYVKTVFLIRFI